MEVIIDWGMDSAKNFDTKDATSMPSMKRNLYKSK
jgi:hypothetical protein